MLTESSGIVKVLLAVLLFPMYFQEAFIRFAWGAGDQFWLMGAKRVFLLLPTMAVLLGCWATIAGMITVPVRQRRQEFITSLFVTWWDLGKSILTFWGGVFRLSMTLLVSIAGMARLLVLAAWALVQDILLMPIHFLRQIAQGVVKSPIPWIAVVLTLSWCVVETTIFTYVMTPLVIDTFSNITGETMTVTFTRVPLFLFLFFVVLGSYAVLATFVDSFKTRSVSTIAGIAGIEAVVLFVEVVFLYREFVDSLVPWFAQYSAHFELGVFWTLAIACFVWFGVRSLSWFLFASRGTPTIMAVIQGRGIRVTARNRPTRTRVLAVSDEYWRRAKKESGWAKAQGEELLSAFLLPPLQVVAAGLNFCTLCVINQHLFRLPFENLEAIRYSEDLINNIKRRSEPFEAGRPAGGANPQRNAAGGRADANADELDSLIPSVAGDPAGEGAARERQPSF